MRNKRRNHQGRQKSLSAGKQQRPPDTASFGKVQPDPPGWRNVEANLYAETMPGIRLHESEYMQLQSFPVPYDENLLERARTQWQFGDWQSLAKLDRETLQHHPDRARLSLLAAAGNMQTDNFGIARQFIRLAQDWGCNQSLINRILIGGVYNSLGRVAALSGNLDKGIRHFETSVAIGLPGNDAQLITKARANQQLEELGLLPDSQGRLREIKTLASPFSTYATTANKPARPSQDISDDAYAFYMLLDAEKRADVVTPFLLLDSKSLPRSGLHYLKNTLARLLGEHFSFCEWYHEVGCCKKRPCALTSYALHAQESNQFRLRLTKSHDFELEDPIFETGEHLRQLILVRDPLFILTSWFALEQIERYRPALLQHGINTQKLWLAHEKEVLMTAYDLLDKYFEEPDLNEFSRWLSEKSSYISGFLDKWVRPDMEQPSQGRQVVQYENIDNFVVQIANEYRDYLSNAARKSVDEFQLQASRFRKRQDPFTVHSKRLTDYLNKHALLIKAVAERIRENDESGYIRSQYPAPY